MVAAEFLGYLDSFKLINHIGVEDLADRLAYSFTVVIFLLCAAIVSMKSYIMKPLACYLSTSPQGNNFQDYAENYCWVHGTIPVPHSDSTPQDIDWNELDKHKRINYYQWVPFVLGLQCVLFYLPRIIWMIICFSCSGTDLERIIATARNASSMSAEERSKSIKNIAGVLGDLFDQHRDYRRGRVASVRNKVYHLCTFCVLSKRLGTWLIYLYVVTKCVALGNCVGQLYLMKAFLGFNDSMRNFGMALFQDMVEGRDWRDNYHFPRVAYCDIRNVRLVGASQNRYMAQCALPVNMLNEKIYIFLWFWVCMVTFIMSFSIPLWIYKVCIQRSRYSLVKKSLRLQHVKFDNAATMEMQINNFIMFLRHDGIFIIRIICLNAGDVVANELVAELFMNYERVRHKFNNELYPDTTGSTPIQGNTLPIGFEKSSEYV